jgi:prevent-host-death family protein
VEPVRISEDIVPVSDFKAQAADWFRKAAATGAPIVVTQNGRPAAVLLSPRAYDELTERARFVAAAQEGLDDAEAGRVQAHADVVKEMKARFGRKRGG